MSGGGGEDFSEDMTNGGGGGGGFEEQHDEMNLNADQADLEVMTQQQQQQQENGGAGDAGGDSHETSGMSQQQQDDSMGATGENGNGNGSSGADAVGGGGEEMDSGDTGSADQYGKDDDRKLFIGGLSWETTEKDLREYFAKYGGIESLTLKMDPSTGRSRGFAFIVFSEVPSLDNVIAAGEHVIQGKKVDPKKAKARQGKIFVGGLSTDISDDDIKNYFTQYGNVVEMEMPIDKSKNQRKGFCFITFDNEQIVHDLLKKPKQIINGKEVDVKKAQPPQSARGGGMMSSWGGSGGRGGGGRGGGMRGRGGRGRGSADYYSGGGYSGYGQGYGSYASYGDYSGYGGYGSGYDSYYGGGYTGYDGYGYDGYEAGPPISRGARGTSTRGLNLCFQGDSNNEGLNEVLNRGTCPTDRRSSNSRSSGPSNSSTSLLGQHNKNPRSFSHLNNWRSD